MKATCTPPWSPGPLTTASSIAASTFQDYRMQPPSIGSSSRSQGRTVLDAILYSALSASSNLAVYGLCPLSLRPCPTLRLAMPTQPRYLASDRGEGGTARRWGRANLHSCRAQTPDLHIAQYIPVHERCPERIPVHSHESPRKPGSCQAVHATPTHASTRERGL